MGNKGKSNKITVETAGNLKKSFEFSDGIKFYCLGGALLMTFILAGVIFGEETGLFFKWYLTVALLGITFMPLTILLTNRFNDSGWIVSKVIGIAVSGWLIWFMSSFKISTFSMAGCIVACVICLLGNLAVFIFYELKNKQKFRIFTDTKTVMQHALMAELLFLVVFIIWLYLKSFGPEAHGTTEKLMDFGFMQAMYKSEYMPPEDLWLAGKNLNYYYVGQFMTTYLSKLSGVGVEYGYNYSLMMIAAFAFSMPLSIISSVASSAKRVRENLDKATYRFFPYLAGAISGIAVTFAGNFHYCMYASIIPKLRDILGISKMAKALDYNFDGFWFPNSTRYIGFDPDVADKTIHEFPSYSFILGDLHAHVINIMFVLAVVAILAGWLLKKKADCETAIAEQFYLKLDKNKKFRGLTLNLIFDPAVIAIGFFIGLFHTTNFWDYPIYFVVSGAIILFVNCILYNFSVGSIILTAIHAVVVLVVSKIVCFPFTKNFDMIASEICISENHSELYQLAILWGIPVILVVAFLFALIKEKKQDNTFDMTESRCGKKSYLFRFIGNLELADMFVLVLGLCAIGLIILPELIYVKDIYSGDYKRSNTMFKLTYQAYIMFGMAMGYIIPKFILFAKKTGERVFGIVMLLLLNWTCGYFKNAVNGWFGDVTPGFTFVEYEEGTHNPIPEDETLYVVLMAMHIIIWFVAIVSAFYIGFAKKNNKRLQIIAASMLTVFFIAGIAVGTGAYTPNSRFKSLNCAEYLKRVNIDDYYATNWINENIEGRPVMLEANGNSYTEYNRVSVRTGLPTILGWRTHEWLWQSNSATSFPVELSIREEAVKDIYTSDNYADVIELIQEYKVKYIYVGSCEREKFGDELNESMLLSLGEVCFSSSEGNSSEPTYIIKLK